MPVSLDSLTLYGTSAYHSLDAVIVALQHQKSSFFVEALPAMRQAAVRNAVQQRTCTLHTAGELCVHLYRLPEDIAFVYCALGPPACSLPHLPIHACVLTLSGEQPPASPSSQHGIGIDSRGKPPPSPDANAATLTFSSSPAPASPSPWSSPSRQQRRSTLLSTPEDGCAGSASAPAAFLEKFSPAAAAAAAAASVASATARVPVLQQLPSKAANVTRTLLPLAPFVVEVPALAAHARAAWPWARSAMTAAVAAAFSRRPFAFVLPPTQPRPYRRWQQQQQPRAIARIREGLEEQACFGPSPLGRRGSCSLSESGSGSGSDGGGNTNDRSALDPSNRSTSCCRDVDAETPSLTRRGAIEKTLVSAARWWAVAAAGSSVAFADADVGATGVGDQSSSKAFTKESYDGFAEGYDDLDGGWAASAMGLEVI